MKLRYLTITAMFASLAQPAMAQVPVTDEKRTVKETEIARCVVRVNRSKTQTLPQAQGIRHSMAAPGTGYQPGQVASGQVMGQAAQSPPQAVAGIDFSGLAALAGGGRGGGIGSALGILGQAAQAIGAVGPAMETNKSGLQQSSQQIGTVESAHGGWAQNSGMRLESAGVWGQGVQVGSTTLQLRNARLMRELEGTAHASRVMSYDPSAAKLVKDQPPAAADNSVSIPLPQEDGADTKAVLEEIERAARALRTDQPLWRGASTATSQSVSPQEIEAAIEGVTGAHPSASTGGTR